MTKTIVFGKIIKKYNIPLDQIKDLNQKYEEVKDNLGSFGPRLAHHNLTGYSSVLFLKVPEFINDAKDPHKFKDGQLGFIGVDGVGTNWITPKVGDFYIFQAGHQHCVMPFKSVNNEIRRSMSFNFIFKH